MKQIVKMRLFAQLGLCLAPLLGFLFTPSTASAGVDAVCVNNLCVEFLCCTNPDVVMHLDMINDLQPDLLNFYNDEMEPALKSMADEWVATIMFQGRVLGGFFDAQAHSAAMLSLQKLTAEAMTDYQPSETLCRFGSLSKSLASSDSLGRRTKIGISERAQNRQMMNANMNSAESSAARRETGRAADKQGRLAQYMRTFCNNMDSNAALNVMCDSNPATPAKDTVDSRQFNSDIDYTRTFDIPLTLELNFAGGGTAATRDQQNLFALGDNLYGNNIMLNRPEPALLNVMNKNDAVLAYTDFKTAIAKRSVVENSFASIAALKTPGTNNSTAYMRTIMSQLGMPATDVNRIIGTTNPSYYAQMDVLSRRMYQDPAFYAELMDKPANVLRQQAAMKAINLMQERDIYDSLERSEMLLSTLLEIYTIREQKALFNKTTSNK